MKKRKSGCFILLGSGFLGILAFNNFSYAGPKARNFLKILKPQLSTLVCRARPSVANPVSRVPFLNILKTQRRFYYDENASREEWKRLNREDLAHQNALQQSAPKAPKYVAPTLSQILEEEEAARFNAPDPDESDLLKVPSHVAQVLKDKYPWQDGPNCFNFVLFYHKLVKSLTSTDVEEFLKKLQNHTRLVDLRNECPQSGDIGVFKTSISEYPLDHAFIYLEEGKVVTKNGRMIDEYYRFQSLDEMLSFYGVSERSVRYYRVLSDSASICDSVE